MRTLGRDLAVSIILEEPILRTSGCCSRRVGSSPARRQSTPAQMVVDETATPARRFLKPTRDSIHQYLATMRRWETIAVLNMSHGGNDIAFAGSPSLRFHQSCLTVYHAFRYSFLLFTGWLGCRFSAHGRRLFGGFLNFWAVVRETEWEGMTKFVHE
jgi:hypothetical protein